jgi:hypothetical protein
MAIIDQLEFQSYPPEGADEIIIPLYQNGL